ncbi:hypothetical protein BKA65DRAFT_553647 [Rhexocercosporidium sp. MPI-PUGE-AT-0058]|nr:hypothetical protein BKA65DRAFT_553647 [Rhexocercosporidium sp. MPI-PUGE-AT-0058]
MQFKTVFLAFAAFTTAYSAVAVIVPADTLPCTPSKDATTCLLNYRTNSGGVLDLTDPETSAAAFIYSSTCLPLGQKTVTVPGETKILSWGLSFSKPLLLGSESRPGINWWTPWFTYDGRRYAFEDCACSGSSLSGGHTCSCPFYCNMFVMD